MNYILALPLLLFLTASQPEPANTNPAVKNDRPATSQPSKDNKGYWIIQPASDRPGKVLVCYYNAQNVLVKKEWRLADEADTDKNRVVRSLKKSLHEALALQTEDTLN